MSVWKVGWLIGLVVAAGGCDGGPEAVSGDPPPVSEDLPSRDDSAFALLAEERERERNVKAGYARCVEATLDDPIVLSDAHTREQRVRHMRTLDLRDCPTDFRTAYLENIQAWEELNAVRAALTRLNSGEEIGTALLGDVLMGALGSDYRPTANLGDAIYALEVKQAELDRAVATTWEKLKMYRTIYVDEYRASAMSAG